MPAEQIPQLGPLGAPAIAQQAKHVVSRLNKFMAIESVQLVCQPFQADKSSASAAHSTGFAPLVRLWRLYCVNLLTFAGSVGNYVGRGRAARLRSTSPDVIRTAR